MGTGTLACALCGDQRSRARARADGNEEAGTIMGDASRNSGIPYVDDVPWGSHLCLFYETQDDLIDAATRFFGRGLDGNELCVWAVPDCLAPAAAAARLRAGIVGFDDHVTAGRMRLFTGTDWYSDGEPDAIARADFWSDVIARALAEGYGRSRYGCAGARGRISRP